MTVRIDMEMPKSCAECQFAIQTDAKRFGYICQLNFTGVYTKDARPSWCLLKPVKEEKGGNMNKDKFFIIKFNKDIHQAIETTIYPDQLLNKKQALKIILDD